MTYVYAGLSQRLADVIPDQILSRLQVTPAEYFIPLSAILIAHSAQALPTTRCCPISSSYRAFTNLPVFSFYIPFCVGILMACPKYGSLISNNSSSERCCPAYSKSNMFVIHVYIDYIYSAIFRGTDDR